MNFSREIHGEKGEKRVAARKSEEKKGAGYRNYEPRVKPEKNLPLQSVETPTSRKGSEKWGTQFP
jgi:hypothetical protein